MERTGRTFRMMLRLALAISEDKDGTTFVLTASTEERAKTLAEGVRQIFEVKGVRLSYSSGIYTTPWGSRMATASHNRWGGTAGQRLRGSGLPYSVHEDHL